MNMKTKYHVFLALSLFAAMLFTSCAEELNVNERAESDEDLSGFTCFSTESDDEGTRTAMYPDGRFKWMNVKKSANAEADSIVDNIFVIKGEGDTIKSSKMVIDNSRDDNTLAKFYLTGSFDKPTYPILYTGSTPVGPSIVSLATKQVQCAPNNSEHFGMSGDCGVAKAEKKGSKYAFKLNHQMAYLMFEPRVEAGRNVLLRKITITEITGKNIAGTFTLQPEGLHPKPFEPDSISTITIFCGLDAEKVIKGDLNPSKAKSYGFYINNSTYDVYNGEKNGRVYAVIRPNDCLAGEKYQLRITYNYVQRYEQTTDHPTLWEWEYTENVKELTKDLTVDFKKNTFYRLRHLLTTEASTIEGYDFKKYYMWGAKDWFWYQAEKVGAEYPIRNDEYQSEYAPIKESTSWFDNQYVYTDKKEVCVGSFSTFENKSWWVNRAQPAANRLKGKLRPGYRHRQAQSNADWENALTANQMSFYVVFGDPYYDNQKPWILKEYNGVETICRGGVWLKKKEKIREYLNTVYNPGKPDYQKVYWPDNNDGSTSNYSAPFPSNETRSTSSSWSTWELQLIELLKNQQFNLRYMAPPINYRMPYTNLGRFDSAPNPGKDGKNIDDYFFLPLLGRFEYDNPQTAQIGAAFSHPSIKYEGEYPNQTAEAVTESQPITVLVGGSGQPTLTLVGSQGYYWTKTPLMYSYMASTKFHKYVYNDDGMLVSENSDLDRYETNPETYQEYAALFNKGNSRTPEEETRYQELSKKQYFQIGSEITGTELINIYRFAEWHHYNDNAYYLNLHHDYIALSWQQHSMYVKTGMRIATRGYDGATGIFK